jgi:hypothetical protein
MTKPTKPPRKKSWPELPENKREEEKAKYIWRNGARVRKP